MIKLLYIIDSYKNPYAGTEGQLLKLIQCLDKNKFEATFVVFRDSDYLKANPFPIPVDVVNIRRLTSPLSWIKLFSYLLGKKRQGYQLAHIFFNDASMLSPLLLKILGYKVLISRRDMGYWYTRLNLLILKFNTMFVDRVIVNSEAVKQITLQKEGYKADDVVVIYNGYIKTVALDGADASTGESPLRFGEDEIRVALVANIRPIKRIADALHAIKIVRDAVKNVVLYVIGDGDQSRLQALSVELGIASSIRLLGPRSDILQLLPQFHVGILCSESEGFSNTLIEYMQSGLPVVCSNVGGNPEIVDHGNNGFLYETGDIQTLAQYLLQLTMDAPLRSRMGQAGSVKVEQSYSLKKYAGQHLSLYEALTSQ